MNSTLRLDWIDLRHRHHAESPAKAVEAALHRVPLDSLAMVERPCHDLARLFAAAGMPGRARDLVSEAERNDPDRERGPNPNRRWSLGLVAFAERRLEVAETELRAAADSLECPICVLPDLGRLYEALGKPDSAIAAYRRYLTTPWMWRDDTDAIELKGVTEALDHLKAVERLGRNGEQGKDNGR